MNSRSRPTVAVVGAGFAGLATAWELGRRGFAVAVYERDRRPGGRARSDSFEGFALETAGPVVSSGDRRLHAFIDAVGLRDDLLPLRPAVAAHCGAGRVVNVDARGLPGIARIPGVRTLHALRLIRLPRLMARYGDRIDPTAPERAADLDDRSVGDFGRLYFGRSVLAHWMGPFVTGASGGDADDLSRVLFLRRYRTHAAERPGLLRAALGELASAAAEKLSVKYGTEAVRLEPGAGGRLALVVHSSGAQRRVEPDAVVVATSAADAARLAAPVLVGAEHDALAGVRYRRALSLAVGLRRPLFAHPQQIQVAHAEGSPIESAVLEPGVRGGRVPDGRGLAMLRATSAWSEAAFDLPEEVACKELMAAFARIQPDAPPAVLFTRLLREERALPHFGVGHYRRIARFERVQRELRQEGRRLYFAADYLMDPSLEGALASAQRAAEAVAADL